MTRGLSSNIQTKLAANERRVMDLIKIVDDAGNNLALSGTDSTIIPLLFTNCDVDLTFDGELYKANNGYLGHSQIQESTNAVNDKITVTFTAVDLTNASAILNSDYVGAKVQIRKAVIEADYSFSADDVYLIYDGFINTFNLGYDTKSAEVQLECGGPFSAFDKTSLYGFVTSTSHQKIFPGDKGMEFAQQTLDELKWGQE